MNKADKIKLLEEWEQKLRELHVRFDALCETIGAIDGPFSESIWRVTTAYTKAVAIAAGDTGEWCEWYEECFILSGWAESEVTAADGRKILVKSVADLVGVLEAE